MRSLKWILSIAWCVLTALSAEAVVTTQGTIDELVLRINRDLSNYRQNREEFENRVKRLQDRYNNLSQEYQQASGDQRIIIHSRLLKCASELVGEYSGFLDTARATISSTLSNLHSLKQIAEKSTVGNHGVSLDNLSKAKLNLLYSIIARIALDVGSPELKKEVAYILKEVGVRLKKHSRGRGQRAKVISGINLLIDRYSDLYTKLSLQKAKLQEDKENIKLTSEFTRYIAGLRPLEEMIGEFEPNFPKIDISPIISELEGEVLQKKTPPLTPVQEMDSDRILEGYINKKPFKEEEK